MILEGSLDARGLRITLVVARFNADITERLQRGALEALKAAGAKDEDISIVQVPGSFEIPLAAQVAASTGEVDAVVCLGCLIKGETPHFDYIASAAAHGITAAAAATGVPMAFGILTTNSQEQALARARADKTNKGWEAATAAIEMATMLRTLRAREGLRA
ncbi:MAG: 6,7-dimethyl-8-ribityllumazine synthase [Acidobacteria bacterium]|nr:6,7-dimethyl-8-ribityllumazine synthase [Acidobacteriota bacterium]